MVDVLPKAQRRKDEILICDDSIVITTVNRRVVLSECKEAISFRASLRYRLRSEVPE